MTENQWKAIIHNDPSYDHKFYYAVKTTGIFCRPSCKSKEPKRENVCVFPTAEQALLANFRPCKRCKPTDQSLPDDDWVARMTQYIDKNYSDKLTLETLSQVCHGSPYHLHRTFKRIMGITPVEYIQQKRVEKAMEYLIDTDQSITEIAMRLGFAGTPYFATVFKKITVYTPSDFRKLNSRINPS